MRAGQPAVHQRQEIPPELTLIGMTGEHLLRVARVYGDLPFAGVIAGAAEGTIEPDLAAAAVDFECHAALRCRILQRRLRLEIVNALVAGLSQSMMGEQRLMVGYGDAACPLASASLHGIGRFSGC